jgi:hypothetical protein
MTTPTVRNVTITSAGTGYTVPGSVSVITYQPPKRSALVLSGENGEVLSISSDGMIEWKGKPSKAAEILIRTFGGHLDNTVIGKQAMERSYRRGIEKCLRMAREMDHDAFIDMLERELQTRTSKAVLMELRRDEDVQ